MNHSMRNESSLWTSNSSWNNVSAGNMDQLCATLQRTFERASTATVASSILIVILNSCFSIFATAVNLLVIVVLSRKAEFDTAANLVLKSMAMSDFLVGMTVQPLTAVYHILDIYGIDSCRIKSVNSFLGMFCVGGSMLSATMFSIDRCFATWFPYRYQEHAIYKKYVAIIVCGWLFLLFSVLMTFFNVLPMSFLSRLMTFSFYCCVLAICFCYVMIYLEVRKIRRAIHVLPAIAQLNDLPQNANNDTEPIDHADNGPDNSLDINVAIADSDRKGIKRIPRTERSQSSTENAARSSRRMSHSYTVVVILSAFLLCYLPVTLVNAITLNHSISEKAQYLAYNWTNLLVLLNSSINPAIYCIRVKKIKDEIKKLLKL